MFTIATAAATAALGSLYLLYRQQGVKAESSREGAIAVKVREVE